MGIIGMTVSLGLGALAVWWFFGFTRYYFRQAPLNGLLAEIGSYLLLVIYFAAVTARCRFDPWRSGTR